MSFGVIYALLFYAASAIFIGGLTYKIIAYSRATAPLKIPTMPAPLTKSGVFMRLFREVALFESLFRSNKWTWIFSWMFHMSMALVLFRHARYFMDPVPVLVVLIQPFGKYASITMILGLVGLLGRRFFVERVRYISSPSDYLMLALMIFIAVTGTVMTFTAAAHTDIVGVKAFMLGILSIDIQNIPLDAFLLMHLVLVMILMVIFPISKLLHAPGIFFSPTRNQVDDSRDKRHIAPWAVELEKPAKEEV